MSNSATDRRTGEPYDLATGRQDLDEAVRRSIGAALRLLGRHWLFIANVLLFLYAALPVIAPIADALGFSGVSMRIFAAYSLTCHQMPSRSFYLCDHQVAYCERCMAIYTIMFLSGLAYARLRPRLPKLPWRAYAILILPIAIDGFTQLFGWRESTWLLRVATGALFGAATIWFTFPYLNESLWQATELL